MQTSHQTIYVQRPTPFSEVYLVIDNQGLRQCSFAPLNLPFTPQLSEAEQTLINAITDAICKDRPAPLPLAPTGTPFQQQVWRALQQMPYGKTCDYQTIADTIGRPKAARAVANAIGKNPIGWFIPCHRVIRRNGQLGGFGWGIELKEQLLNAEQQYV